MENIFSTSKSFLRLAKFLGIFPMSFEGPPKEGVLKVKWHDLALSFLSFSALIALVVKILNFSQDEFTTSSSNILMNAWKAMKNTELQSFIVMFFYQIYRRKNIFKFLQIIHKIDQEVSFKTLYS